MKILVAQKGWREHFLVARVLHSRGMLAQLVVDWVPPGGRLLARLVGHLPWRAVTRAFDCYSLDFPRRHVHSMNLWALRDRKRLAARTREGRGGEATLESDQAFAQQLTRLRLAEHDVFFGYSYASLEMLIHEKKLGKLTVLDQLDPGLEEHLIISEEEKRFPDYVTHPRRVPDAYYDRMKREWEESDLIIVNSEWSRDCAVKHGCNADKIHIVPLAYEPERTCAPSPRRPVPPLRVLWLGRITLQKGIQYLLQTADMLRSEPVEFIVAGAPMISPEIMAVPRPNVQWMGKVTWEKVDELFSSSHVFVLPTLSDGFALTQLETMSRGTPVIATTHCGRVVEDGVNGFLVPPRDPAALAEAIMRFVENPGLSAEMAPSCVATSERFSVDRFGEQLSDLLMKHVSGGGRGDADRE